MRRAPQIHNRLPKQKQKQYVYQHKIWNSCETASSISGVMIVSLRKQYMCLPDAGLELTEQCACCMVRIIFLVRLSRLRLRYCRCVYGHFHNSNLRLRM